METLPVPVSTPMAQSAVSLFSESNFDTGQRMAKLLTSSDLVPAQFRGNLANAFIALEMAQRTGSSPLAVMQNLHIIHGRPSWSAQFIIAALNSCGRFSPLRFSLTGEGSDRQAIAWAVERESGERLDGPPVSIAMAKAEGWLSKAGSKWLTMPELMLRYRAATFFGRLYAPDILMGMRSTDELLDTGGGKNGNVETSNPAASVDILLAGDEVQS